MGHLHVRDNGVKLRHRRHRQRVRTGSTGHDSGMWHPQIDQVGERVEQHRVIIDNENSRVPGIKAGYVSARAGFSLIAVVSIGFADEDPRFPAPYSAHVNWIS
jgi:hypothetical protein